MCKRVLIFCFEAVLQRSSSRLTHVEIRETSAASIALCGSTLGRLPRPRGNARVERYCCRPALFIIDAPPQARPQDPRRLRTCGRFRGGLSVLTPCLRRGAGVSEPGRQRPAGRRLAANSLIRYRQSFAEHRRQKASRQLALCLLPTFISILPCIHHTTLT